MSAYCYLVLPEAKVKKVLAHQGETMLGISKELHACCQSLSGRRLFWSALKRLSTESVSSTMSEARAALAKLASITEADYEKVKGDTITKIEEILASAGLDERRDVTVKYFERELVLRIAHQAEHVDLELTAELRQLAFKAGKLAALPPQEGIEVLEANKRIEIAAAMLKQAAAGRKTLNQFLADEGESVSGEKLLTSPNKALYLSSSQGVVKTHSRELRTKDPAAWKLEEAYLKEVCSEGKHVQEEYEAQILPEHGTWTPVATSKCDSQQFQNLGVFKWAPTGANANDIHTKS
eukprot:6477313-Amphidinium_carterae.1